MVNPLLETCIHTILTENLCHHSDVGATSRGSFALGATKGNASLEICFIDVGHWTHETHGNMLYELYGIAENGSAGPLNTDHRVCYPHGYWQPLLPSGHHLSNHEFYEFLEFDVAYSRDWISLRCASRFMHCFLWIMIREIRFIRVS